MQRGRIAQQKAGGLNLMRDIMPIGAAAPPGLPIAAGVAQNAGGPPAREEIASMMNRFEPQIATAKADILLQRAARGLGLHRRYFDAREIARARIERLDLGAEPRARPPVRARAEVRRVLGRGPARGPPRPPLGGLFPRCRSRAFRAGLEILDRAQPLRPAGLGLPLPEGPQLFRARPGLGGSDARRLPRLRRLPRPAGRAGLPRPGAGLAALPAAMVLSLRRARPAAGRRGSPGSRSSTASPPASTPPAAG